MPLRSLYTRLGRARAIYDRWVAESHICFVANAHLLHAARDEFDQSRTVRSDHVPWCMRCGERLEGAFCEVPPGDGIHGRCRP